MIRTRQYILAIGDFAMLAGGLFLMITLRFGYHYHPGIVADHIRAFFPLFIAWILVFFVFNLYDIRSINPNPRTIGRLGMAVLTTTILSGFFFYVQPDIGIRPRTNLLIVSTLSFVFIILWRRVFYLLFASVFSRKIMLVGTSAELVELKNHLDEQVPLGRVVWHAGTVSQVVEKHDIGHVDLVITDTIVPEDVVRIEKHIDARVITLADAYSELFAKIPLSLMNDERAVRLAVRTRNYTYPYITRIFEIIISALILIVFSPILLIAGALQKMEDGGDMFLRNHLRIGKDGKIFHLQKIRSMVPHAERDGIKWTEKEDSRITRVGRVIRKLHIDEVPQLWNVIKGDMALVGPRPEQPEFVASLEKDIPYYYLRHIIKPGFTGWAQIKFRYARTVTDSSQKLEYDLYYLENRSPLLDLGIIAKTIQIIFTH